jgi:protein-disulfide isomerase
MIQPSSPAEISLRADKSIDHILGPERASVTLIEYGDLECPSCRQAQTVMLIIRERFADRVNFVFRHFPLAEVHPHASLAAEAAEAAAAQGKFWEYIDLLFQRQLNLDADHLCEYAGALQLDVDRFRDELERHAHGARVREHIALGNQLRVRATPTFFLNGHLVDVSFGMEQLQRAMDVALASKS